MSLAHVARETGMKSGVKSTGLHHFIAAFDSPSVSDYAQRPPAAGSPGETGDAQPRSDRTPMMMTAQTSLLAFGSSVAFGGIVTTVNPRHTADQLANQLNDAGAKCLITTSQFSDRALAATERSREAIKGNRTTDRFAERRIEPRRRPGADRLIARWL